MGVGKGGGGPGGHCPPPPPPMFRKGALAPPIIKRRALVFATCSAHVQILHCITSSHQHSWPPPPPPPSNICEFPTPLYCILHPRLESVQQTGGHSIYYFFFVQVVGRFSLQTLSPFPSFIRMYSYVTLIICRTSVQSICESSSWE